MKSYSATGIILKRTNIGETDRIVTLFSKEYGKITCVAKGARKITSSNSSALEPGMVSKVYLIRTKSLPILTQAQPVSSYASNLSDLIHIRKVFEILEILDSLLIEADEQPQVFDCATRLLTHLSEQQPSSTAFVRRELHLILEILGFADEVTTDLTKPITEFIEEITQKKLKAYAYLQTY